jgi:ribosomal protein L15
MILKFKFKDAYWERAGFQGPNMFIKALPPKVGYQNFGIGKLPEPKPGQTFTVITDKMLSEMVRRKQVIILEEYVEDEYDTDQQSEGLSTEGDSTVPPAE